MEEASILFSKMIRSGSKPNIVPYNVLIDGFGKASNISSAQAMYEKMPFYGCSSDVVTFTALIDGYCQSRQLHCSLDLWHKMNLENISPSLHAYSILVSTLCKNNRLHEALLNQSAIIPKPFVYNPVMDGYCKSGNHDEVNAIVTEMEEKGCWLDKPTFTILIIGHCMKGRMHEAIAILVHYDPDDITVNSLRLCILKVGMPGEAARINRALLKKN